MPCPNGGVNGFNIQKDTNGNNGTNGINGGTAAGNAKPSAFANGGNMFAGLEGMNFGLPDDNQGAMGGMGMGNASDIESGMSLDLGTGALGGIDLSAYLGSY